MQIKAFCRNLESKRQFEAKWTVISREGIPENCIKKLRSWTFFSESITLIMEDYKPKKPLKLQYSGTI